MSSIVSRRPSFKNHSKEAFWMSMRLGRSRTCLRREKLLRARGAATMVVKFEISLPYGSMGGKRGNVGGTAQHSGTGPHPTRQASRGGATWRHQYSSRGACKLGAVLQPAPEHEGRSWRPSLLAPNELGYFSSTVAPASSSCAFIELASSVATPSLTV